MNEFLSERRPVKWYIEGKIPKTYQSLSEKSGRSAITRYLRNYKPRADMPRITIWATRYRYWMSDSDPYGIAVKVEKQESRWISALDWLCGERDLQWIGEWETCDINAWSSAE